MDTFDTGGELTVGRLGFGAMRVTGEDIIGEPDDPATARWPATPSSTTTTAMSTTRCRQANRHADATVVQRSGGHQ